MIFNHLKLWLTAFLYSLFLGGAVNATTIVLQPGPGLNDGSDTGTQLAGKDTGYANGAYTGSENLHWISNPTWAGPGRAYFQFDPLSEVSAGTVVTSATLTLTNLFRSNIGWPRTETLTLDTINSAWSENSVSGYLPTTAFASVSANPVSDWALIDDPLAPGNGAYLGEVDFDVTSLVQSWFDTPASNNGVSYGIGGSAYPYNTIDPYVFTSDADGALAAYRPTLTIEFEGGEAKVSEPGGIMMLGLGLAGIVVIRRRCKAG